MRTLVSLLLVSLLPIGPLAACARPPAARSPAPQAAVERARRPQAPRFLHIASLSNPSLRPVQPSSTAAECDPQCQAYVAAVQATEYPSAAGISRALTALLPDTPGLIWNDQGQILMGTWTTLDQFAKYEPGEPFPLDGDTWWTAAPAMQDFCRATGLSGEALDVRIAQRLGMPAATPNDGFVQVWLDPQTIFRPCPDPEIQDSECQVEIPVIPPFAPTDGEPPWACAGQQVSGSFVQVQDAHLAWMCQNWVGSFSNSDPAQDFPWTALGYTYDWGQEDHVGPSEFVTLDGTEAVLESSVPTAEYCAPAR